MSCPSSHTPLLARLGDVDEYVSLPKEYYFMTIGMVALVFTVPFIYRQLWLFGLEILEIIRQTDNTSAPAGCLKIGKSGNRNLSEEYSKKTLEEAPLKVAALFSHPVKSGYPIEVQETTITPVGFEHDRQFCFATWHEPTPVAGVEMNPEQLPKKKGDAYWRKVKHWATLTQRKQPFLTLIKTEIWGPNLRAKGYSADAEFVKSEGCLVFSFPFSPPNNSIRNCWINFAACLKARRWDAEPVWSFTVPFKPTAAQIKEKGFQYEKVRIWRDEPAALDMTSEIPEDMLEMLRYSLGKWISVLVVTS
jgi:hypothetical protein